MKCETKYCRKRAARGRAKCWACVKRAYRKKNRLRAYWHNHRTNAKQRGIPVIWDWAEFSEWAEEYSLLFNLAFGWEIHRIDFTQGYFGRNCVCLPAEINNRLSHVEKRISSRKVSGGSSETKTK